MGLSKSGVGFADTIAADVLREQPGRGVGWSAFDLTRLRVCLGAYLLIAVPVLLALAFLVAPFQTADEAEHFLRAVQISQGHVLPRVAPSGDAAGDQLDTTLAKLGGYYEHLQYDRWFQSFGAGPQDIRASWRARLTGHTSFVNFSNTVIYFPIAHAAPAAVIAVMRALHTPPLAWLYAGRLTNLTLAVLISCIGLALMPDARMFGFVFLLMPRVLFNTATLSADALLLPLALVFGALVTRMARNVPLSRSQYGLLVFAMFYICVSKIAYIPLIAVPPFVAWMRARRISGEVVFLSVSAVLVAGVWAAWTRAIHGAVFSMRYDAPIDVYQQLHGLLRQPLRYFVVVKNALAKQGLGYINSMSGSDLASRQTRLPGPPSFITLAALVASAFLAEKRYRTEAAALAFSGLACLGAVIAIFLFLYLQYTPIGAPAVEGVQGRYFLPLLPLLAGLSPKWALQPQGRGVASAVLAGWLAVVSCETLLLMKLRYWDTPPASGERFVTSTHVPLEGSLKTHPSFDWRHP